MRIIDAVRNKCVLCVLAVALLLALALPPPGPAFAATTERVENAYVGARDFREVLFNIDFPDVVGAWSQGAVYEGGALDIVKGFGAEYFGRELVMTKAQALAMVFRAAGREAEAQLAGEKLETANRSAGLPAADADTVWVNGCLQLARDGGLISKDDYDAALGDAAAQARSAFRRGQPATRQEFGYWMALALGIAPVRGQQALFTNYADWRSADSLYIPYLEAALREHMMSGNADGTFLPLAGITREQAAQVVKNASRYVYAKNGVRESEGTVERVDRSIAAGPTGAKSELSRTVFYVRNALGALDTITTEASVSDSSGAASAARSENGLVVNVGGGLDDGGALRQSDRIRYLTAKNPETGGPDIVKYVEALPSAAARSYVLAQIDRIDAAARRIVFTQFFPIAYPTAGELKRVAAASPELARLSAEYRYGGDLSVVIDGKRAAADDLAPGMNVILGVENYRNIFWIETTGLGYRLGETGIVRGIVEENNPVLGYLSLYSEPSGSGSGAGASGASAGSAAAAGSAVLADSSVPAAPALALYSYTDPARIDVRKDGAPTQIDAIEAGDSAYVKLDGNGEIAAISAVENYKLRYGTVLSVSGNSAVVRYDTGGAGGETAGTGVGAGSGLTQNLELGADVLYFQDYRLVSKAALVPGASIRALMHDSGGSSTVREITIASLGGGGRGLVGSVYKAVLSRIDEASRKAVVYDVQRLRNGKWEKVPQKGFGTIPIDEATQIYLNNESFAPARVNKLLRGNEVYIAARTDYGGAEVAALVNIRGADDKEQLYDDVIKSVRRPAGLFGLAKGPSDIAAGNWTIVVKDGRLVMGANIETDDQVYVVASREDATGRMKAEVVEIFDRVGAPQLEIYRGRVSKITRDTEFTLESFSQLEGTGTEWRYANTPKTFSISYDTRLLTENGVEPARNFDSRGANNYVDAQRTVYVVARGNEALAISAAPYGIVNLRGEAGSFDGVSYDEDGRPVEGPTGVTLYGVSIYDRVKYVWADQKGDAAIAIGLNSLIIKGDEILSAADIEKGDRLRVVTTLVTTPPAATPPATPPPSAAATGTGYIIIVEN
ncbi:MAG: S-layer homology domain-containing protein [Clostridiales bacterium]|jgi:uncharacterized protein YuzE|nr:S-layer homology domain-containing protein [Clostridiales bacterium]